MTVTPTTAPLATIIAHLAAWRASNQGDVIEVVCDTEDALIATQAALETLVQTWRAQASILDRLCADQLEALLTKGPIPSELENGEAVTHD